MSMIRGSQINMTSPFKSVLLADQVTGEVYELVVNDGKLEIIATSEQGKRQQSIEKIIE